MDDFFTYLNCIFARPDLGTITENGPKFFTEPSPAIDQPFA